MNKWMPLRLRVKLAMKIIFSGSVNYDWKPGRGYWQMDSQRNVIIAVRDRINV